MNFTSGNHLATSQNEKIAIIGLAFRLPGDADSLETLWQMLCDRRSGIREISEDRFSVDRFYDANHDALGKSYTKWAGLLSEIDRFDPKFFGLAPREAASMDPQQRLVLETAYGAIEDARLSLSEMSRLRTGVFVGVSQSDYKTVRELNPVEDEKYAGTGYAMSIVANRVSHRLNLTGPSFSVDTACSSSLVALDAGVRNLQAGTCDMALVGGVNVIAHPAAFVAFSKAGMLSPTGELSTFDKAANGYVRGEGVGVVLLKPYAAALQDGNQIHAVIEATSVNQDGQTGTMTAPSPEAQIRVIERLFHQSGRAPGDVGYAEAHGTGTPVGDPIEAGSIGQAIGRRIADRKLYIGSIKPNIGHLESAAGLAGLIKAVMTTKRGEIPPNTRFSDPNPAIPLDALNLEVPRDVTPFPDSHGQRLAVVNSFGFGGTNASVLISSPLERAAPRRKAQPVVSARRVLVPLSAASPAALARIAHHLLDACRDGALANTPLSDIAASLAAKPAMFGYRAAILCASHGDLLQGLEVLSAEDLPEDLPDILVMGQTRRSPKIVFTYSGQGNQSWNMARDLMAHEPVFRSAMEAFDGAYRDAAGWSILDEMAKDEAVSRIHETWVTQPALVAVQYALSALWRSWGVTPEIVLGHSVGEITAALDSGAITLKSAARYLSKRSVIRAQITKEGAMAAVGLPPDDVAGMLKDNPLIDIAGRNSPGATTISGEKDAIHAFVAEFEMENPETFIRLLKIDGAWHSHQLDEAEDWLRKEVGSVDWQQPSIDFMSTVTAKPETRLDLDYWWDNLRQTVSYADAVESAIELGGSIFLEIGPHTTLKPLTLSTALEKGAIVDAVSSMSHKYPDLDHFARAAAELFVMGANLDWTTIHAEGDASLPMPGYAWDHEQLWKSSEESERYLHQVADHPLLGQRVPGPTPVWRHEFDVWDPAFLKDHRYAGEALFPAAGYVDLMLAAGQILFPDQVLELENCAFHKALFLPTEGSVQLQTQFNADRGQIEIQSRMRNGPTEWEIRASATLRPVDVRPAGQLTPAATSTAPIRTPDPAEFYAMLEKAGDVSYGPAFQTIRALTVQGRTAIGTLSADETCRADMAEYVAHPALLDGAIQTLFKEHWIDPDADEDTPAFLPTGIVRLRSYGRLPADLLLRTEIDETADFEDGIGQIDIADSDGRILLSVTGLRAKEMPKARAVSEDELAPPDFIVETFEEITLEPMSADGPKGRWLVLAEDTPEVAGLMAALSAQGAEVSRRGQDNLGTDITDALADILIDAADPDVDAPPLAGVVFGWPLSAHALSAECDAQDIYEAVRRPVQALLETGIALHDIRGFAALPKVVLLTRGARQTDMDTQTPAGVAAASLVSTMRALSSELPEIQFQNVDVLPEARADAPLLAGIVLTDSAETELALRGDRVFAARLNVRAREDLPLRSMIVTAGDDINFKTTMPSPGVIDHLDLFECPNPDLAPDEVRVAIRAVGLNFRDIMAVTGLLPEEAETEPAWQNLGLEFSGDILEVGAGVSGFVPGDRVMGMYKNCMQRFLTLPVDGLIRMHDDLRYDEAVTIPSAFATAHYALNQVGRLSEGEKVLIHVATGGVGLAAVQMAQAVGAEIFATAGSDAKRDLLRDLGVAHVMNSRSLDYADEIMAITGGKGVDVILNSLPGSHIDKGLDLLSPYGRFLEIGKRDVYADHAIGMKAMRRNLAFNVIDLAAMGNERPDLLARQMSAVMTEIAEGRLKPLPTTNFAVADAAEAFRYMSQAKHVGKVVITFDADSYVIKGDRNKPVTFREDASYLVTGGTRGFSLALADWMSRQGAGKLLLGSRSGKAADEDQPTIEAMRARGTEVDEVVLDVTDPEAVQALVTRAAADAMKPLAGVLHGAAVIKDTLITMMTPELLEDVLRPKIIGGWALHQADRSLDTPLEFIIGFSSVAQVIGSLGQSNYVAANSFLDALAEYRAQTGHHGGTIDWGVIADAGFVARDEQLANYLETAGMAGITTSEAEHGLGTLLQSDAPRFCYARGDWQQVGRANTALGRTARFKSLISGAGKDDSDLAKRLALLSGDALVTEIAGFVIEAVSDLLKVELTADDMNMPMSEAGLDSLSSFELKMKLETELGVSIMASHFLKGPTIAELSNVLADAFEAERARKAATALSGDTEDGAGTASSTQARQFTDRQIGLVSTSVARFTSPGTRLALEHRTRFDCPADTAASDLQKALYALYEAQPILGLTCSIAAGEAPVLAIGDAPRLAEGHLGPDEPLDVAQGALLRIAQQDGALQIVMHAALGDRGSLDLLQTQILSALADPDAPVPDSSKALRTHLSALAYQPETEQGLRDRAFWDHSLRNIPTRVDFSRRGRALPPEKMGRDHGPAVRRSGAILGTTASETDVLLAYAVALDHLSGGRDSVLIARDVPAGPRDTYAALIGPFTITQPLVVPAGPPGSWRVADFRRLLAATPDHQAFDIWTATAEFPARFKAAQARPNQIAFAWQLPQDDAAGIGVAHDVRLEAALTDTGLRYAFTFDADVVSEAEQTAIVTAFTAVFDLSTAPDPASGPDAKIPT